MSLETYTVHSTYYYIDNTTSHIILMKWCLVEDIDNWTQSYMLIIVCQNRQQWYLTG